MRLNPWVTAATLAAALICAPVASLLLRLVDSSSEVWDFMVTTLVPGYALNTLVVLVGSGLLCILLGVPTAWVLAVYRFPGSRFFAWALVLPLALPAYIMAYTYAGIFDYGGPVHRLLGGAPLDVMNLPGAIAVMGFALYPYVYMTARVSFLRQSRPALEAARSLGCTSLACFWQVGLPLARPAIAAGAALAGMEVLNEYGAFRYYGIDTFTTAIFGAWFSFGDVGAAIRLAACLLLFVLCLLLLERSQRGRARYVSAATERPLEARSLHGLGAVMAGVLCAVPLVGGFVVPTAQLAVWAWDTGPRVIDAAFWGLLGHSFGLALAAGALVAAVALLLGYVRRLFDSRLIGAFIRLALMGYAVPGAVIAVGVMVPLIRLDRLLAAWLKADFGVSVGLLLSGTLVALLYAYLVRFLAVAYQPLEAGLTRLGPHLEEAARSLGAGPWRTLLRIDLPLMRGALGGAVLMVFVDVLKELPLTLILRPFDFDTLATRAFELASDERIGEAAGPSLIIVGVGLLPAIGLHSLIGKKT